ncbi:MAG: hypothetical protein GF421_00130 [Candidatus Aminicenantes bacterium]|nr:hypothetical protein [Candidatus Aminicenantes bacterium]
MKRKDFLVVTGRIFLGGILTALGVSCKSPVSPDEDEKTFVSDSGTHTYSHTHSVTIQKSEIETPPSNGISRWTTNYNFDYMKSDFGHTHLFSMTKKQLLRVRNGEAVKNHTF